MAILASIYLKKAELEQLLASAEKGIALDISINDKTSQYGKNIEVYVPQTKEERMAKKPKSFVGNGKVFWTDGKATVAEKVELPKKDALPF